MKKWSRRRLIVAAPVLGASLIAGNRYAWSVTGDRRFDFNKMPEGWEMSEGWEMVSGRWTLEDIAGASGGGRALVQRATNNEFNVIVAPGGPYSDVEVSVRFKPISGHEDASGGIVFRFSDGRYYVIRANALEVNFRLYYYDRHRYMLASASVAAPKIGEWQTLQISAERDNLRGWLNGRALINHRDARFTAGRVGLWTKTDSITAFDSLVVTPKSTG
ncbi:MAG TPA: family 16 glycoside hydrolase [Candidatus Udaeobacter sp.]|nr:family 16 glycoside hydrolase [Candidatus Udaeobacter sp.]